ncbi:MAG: flagellar hook-length control protein FliK [Micropepsaceae bacterium]
MRNGIVAPVMNDIASFFATAAAAPVSGAGPAAPAEDAGTSVFATLLAQLQGAAAHSGSTQNGELPATGSARTQGLTNAVQSTSTTAKGAPHVKNNARGTDAEVAATENTSSPSDLAALAFPGQPAQSAEAIIAKFAAQAAAQATPAALQGSVTTSQASVAAQENAALKTGGAKAASEAPDALHPAFAQLLANAKEGVGHPRNPAATTTAKRTSGEAAQAASPAIAAAGTNTHSQALTLDDKAAINATNGASANSQHGAGNQAAHQSGGAIKPMDQNAAAQAGATSQPQSFAVDLVQVQSSVSNTTLPGQVPLEALAVQIARKFDQGISQFEISLHPAELGKLDISLKVSDDGRVNAVLRAERPETLDLLRQDSKHLEAQLRQAGLDVGSSSLSFQLSHGNNQRQAQNSSDFGRAFGQQAQSTPTEETRINYVAVRKRDGLDIHV